MNKRMRRLFASRAAGITIVEIMFGLLIIGLFIGMMLPVVNSFMNQARMRKTTTNLQAVKVAIQSYVSDVGSQPASITDLLSKPAEPRAASRWRGPYVEDRMLRDGWENELVFTPGQGLKFQLYSWGTGGEGSDDTVISAFED